MSKPNVMKPENPSPSDRRYAIFLNGEQVSVVTAKGIRHAIHRYVSWGLLEVGESWVIEIDPFAGRGKTELPVGTLEAVELAMRVDYNLPSRRWNQALDACIIAYPDSEVISHLLKILDYEQKQEDTEQASTTKGKSKIIVDPGGYDFDDALERAKKHPAYLEEGETIKQEEADRKQEEVIACFKKSNCYCTLKYWYYALGGQLANAKKNNDMRLYAQLRERVRVILERIEVVVEKIEMERQTRYNAGKDEIGNDHLLAGIRCPECGSYGPFNILCTAWFEVDDGGTGNPKNVGWDNESTVKCANCGKTGVEDDFTSMEDE